MITLFDFVGRAQSEALADCPLLFRVVRDSALTHRRALATTAERCLAARGLHVVLMNLGAAGQLRVKFAHLTNCNTVMRRSAIRPTARVPDSERA